MTAEPADLTPPPPTAPNVMPAAPPAPALSPADPADALRGINIVAGVVALFIAAGGYMIGLAGNGTQSFAIGSALGSLAPPAILGAVIGWGNDKRARIAFIVLGVLLTLVRMLGSMGA